MLLTPIPKKWPLTKERQVGHFGKAHKRKERYKFLKPGTENQLLKDAVEYLKGQDIPFIRLLEDWQWEWIYFNAPKELRQAFSDNFSGWCDLFIFRKTDKKHNLVLGIELKSEGRKQHKSQKKRAGEINIELVDNFQRFKELVEEFQK